MHFHNFIIISPWKWELAFIWTTWNPFTRYLRMFHAKCDWPMFSWWNCEKTDTWTDGRQAIRKIYVSFQPKWAKTNWSHHSTGQHFLAIHMQTYAKISEYHCLGLDKKGDHLIIRGTCIWCLFPPCKLV